MSGTCGTRPSFYRPVCCNDNLGYKEIEGREEVTIEEITPHGMCAGVRAAVKLAMRHNGAYCLHSLVHNDIITGELKALGYHFVEDVEEVPDGATIVFSAHGVAPSVRDRAAEKKLKVVDATCPFVERSHRAVRDFCARGLPVVIIGDPEHVEVKGLVGEITDSRKPQKGERIGVVSQTTLNADDVRRRVEELDRDYVVDGLAEVCNATKERQAAVRAFDGDALLVLGNKNSNNTRKLCEVANCHVFLASNMDEIRKAREEMEGYDRIGVTSGASTPERFFEDAVNFLRRVPRHVAFIMDGNGRWATKRGKKRGFGHIAGAKTLTRVVEWCGERGIQYVTVYAFSTENWRRPKEEVSGLMKLFAAMLKSQALSLVKNKVRLRVIGRRSDLSKGLQNEIEKVERLTSGFDRQLVVCLSYGGRAELVDAVNKAVEMGEKVTEESFRDLLYAPDVPDPDLVVRTSGERRISNFLLWECAYSEYHFTDVLWPDFSERDLDAALEDYSSRHRRKGGVV